MTDDFEQRLRASLDDHAKQADPQLSGPELRRLSAERNRPAERLRRSAPVLATAAAVAGIGIAAAILTSPGNPSPPPIQPGGPAGPGTSAPASPASPSASAPRSTPVPGPRGASTSPGNLDLSGLATPQVPATIAPGRTLPVRPTAVSPSATGSSSRSAGRTSDSPRLRIVTQSP